MYNKTALNKIKKADLIALFLEQQAEKNQLVLDSEENEKLKNDIGYLKHQKSIEIAKLKEFMDEINKLKEENKKLKEENDEWKEVASVYWVETPSELESWLSASIHQDDEVYSKYMEPLELRDEVEELKEKNKKLNQLNDYAYKQMNELMSKVTLLTDEIEKLKEESDSESDEECDQCVCCEVKFDQHEARYNMGEDLRLKYQKYFGSEKDDGDICPECLNRISD